MTSVARVREALEQGRLMEAVDEARDLLEAQPENAEVLYLKALALSRLGTASVAAATVGELLRREGVPPNLRAEGLALQGRLFKDLAARAAGSERSRLALEASAPYEAALRLRPDAFFAVNAATLHRVAGEREASAALAREALRLAGEAAGPGDHWRAATLGECALLLGDAAEARRRYRDARALAGGRFGDVASMRRQLRLLASVLPEAQELLEEVAVPRVVAFTGHMIDAPGRAQPRFPASLEPAVAEALERWLDRAGAVIGHAQAACGADILFLEALQRRGYETHVTLPCATRDYLEQSVAFAGSGWVERFHRVLGSATTAGHATAEAYLGDQVLFEHASRFIDGRVLLRAAQLQAEAMMLAVLDAGAAGAIGGTLQTFEEWRRAGHAGELIDLGALRREHGAIPAPGAAIPPPDAAIPARTGVQAAAEPPPPRREICAMIFCDVRGYSKVNEQYSPLFQRRFLGEARKVIDGLRVHFRTAQTAGDGIYATFASVPAAAEFSLELRDRVSRIDWTEYGMPADTHVRVALHCGPAFPIMDPVTDAPNFCGSHVNRTARIEPVVTPGEVFATEVVAAYLALQAPREYASDYLGVLPLAKGFGAAALYRLRRA